MTRRLLAALVLAALWPGIRLFELWGWWAERRDMTSDPAPT